MLVGGFAARHRFVRIALAELGQGKSDALRKAQGFGDRFGAVAEQPRAFPPAVSDGVRHWPPAVCLPLSSVTCSRMQVTTSCNSRRSGCVIKRVIDRNQRHARFARQTLSSRAGGGGPRRV